MGDSSPPQLRAPSPGADAPVPVARAEPKPPPRPPPQIATVQPPPFRRDSSRTCPLSSPPGDDQTRSYYAAASKPLTSNSWHTVLICYNRLVKLAKFFFAPP